MRGSGCRSSGGWGEVAAGLLGGGGKWLEVFWGVRGSGCRSSGGWGEVAVGLLGGGGKWLEVFGFNKKLLVLHFLGALLT